MKRVRGHQTAALQWLIVTVIMGRVSASLVSTLHLQIQRVSKVILFFPKQPSFLKQFH